jgi:hypothetical protein
VEGFDFDEAEFFRRIAASGARAVLIGRRALVLLGLPVLTSDYDFWVHVDDAEKLNEALEPMGFVPNRSPEEARTRGRYVLENDEHVDVLLARAVSTVDGVRVPFEDLWARRKAIAIGDTTDVFIPTLDDLISTKRFAARPKDSEDIRLLESLKREGSAP